MHEGIVLEIQRDDKGIAHIVPVSGGKDSTCLALALKAWEPRPYNYIYTPTGDELPEMVEHLAKLEKLLRKKNHKDFERDTGQPNRSQQHAA